MLDRADQVGSTECIVYKERYLMLMRDTGQGLDVRDIRIRISQGLDEDRFRPVIYRAFYGFQVMDIDESRLYAVFWKRIVEEVVAASVDRILSYDIIAGGGKRKNGIGDCSSAC